MDKPVEELGPAHQIKRHDIVKTPKLVAEIFGKKAKKAARDHILLDTRWGRVQGQIGRSIDFHKLSIFADQMVN